MDGIYAIRTSVEPEWLDDEATVRAYNGLARMERAFRSMKSPLQLKPHPASSAEPLTVRGAQA